MNIKRVIRKSNLEELIVSFTKVSSLSLCIKDVSKETVFTLSNTDRKPLFNYPIKYEGITIGELFISEKGFVADFVIQLINNTLIKEDQIAEINDETLLMYREVNLFYELSNTFNTLASLEDHLNYLLKKCVTNLQAANASIWLIEDDMLKCIHSRGFRPERTFKLGEGVIGEVALLGSGELLNYQIDDPRLSGKINENASIIVVPLKTQEKKIGVFILSKHNKTLFAARELKLTNVFAHQITLQIENDKLMERIKQELLLRTNLSRFLSPNVAELIIDEKQETSLGGEKKAITVLFSDIVGFTSLSECLDSEEIVEMLNEYFSSMTDIIFDHSGTLDKFIGDSIMAIFGAPNEIENQVEVAVKVGLLMQKTNAEIQNARRRKGQISFRVRVGLHAGLATVGNIGSPNRLDYTAIGDTVNVASRLEGAASPGGVLIGESIYVQVKDLFKMESLEPLKVKGKSEPLKVYKVLG